MKNGKSKRIFLTVLLVLALFMFSGCGNSNDTVDPDTPNQTNDMTDDKGVIDDVKDGVEKGVDDMERGIDDMTDDVTSPSGMDNNENNMNNMNK